MYIQVPSRESVSSEIALELFHQEVPALHLLGIPHYISPDIPYTVDDDVQLVCKYLRAYKAGNSELSIDKLYKEGGPLVKFSLEPDLTEENCYKLLKEFMPDHIVATKITQQLFIR